MNTDNLVTMIVGGVSYTLSLEDIDPHVDSYFACVLKDTWNANPSAPVVIARDGVVFKFIYIYLCTMKFEFHASKIPTLPHLVSIRREADYFNLAGLVKQCDDKIMSYLTSWCVRDLPKRNLCAFYECVVDSTREGDLASVLARQLHNGIFAGEPFFSSIPSVCDRACYMDDDWNYVNTKSSRHVVTCEYRLDKVATIYAIRQAAQEGGRIVVTRNGTQRSISKAGEYIVCMAGSTVDIEPILAGHLVLFKGRMCLKYQFMHGNSYTPCIEQFPVEPTIPADMALATIRAVHQELQSRPGCSGVVVCLSSYYPVSDLHLDLESPHSEVDAALLTGLDQAYYQLLAEHFEVVLVTVYVQFVTDCTGFSTVSNTCRGCVICPAPIACESTVSADPVKMRIFPPPYGYGHPLNTVRTGGDQGSLLTGLMLSERV